MARNLLHYGALVERRLEIHQLEHHYTYEEGRSGYVDPRARFVADGEEPLKRPEPARRRAPDEGYARRAS